MAGEFRGSVEIARTRSLEVGQPMLGFRYPLLILFDQVKRDRIRAAGTRLDHPRG